MGARCGKMWCEDAVLHTEVSPWMAVPFALEKSLLFNSLHLSQEKVKLERSGKKKMCLLILEFFKGGPAFSR